MSQQGASEASGGGPGVSNLVHLFGDRFVPLARGKGPQVFGRTDTTVAVDRNQLATTLIAASVWGLREAGLVRLEQRQEKKLGLIKVKRTHMWPMGDGPGSGDLERRVLALIRTMSGESGLTEYNLVRSLVPEGEEPYGWVVGAALIDAEEQGYVTRTTNAKGQLTGFEPVRERLAALEPAAADVATRWKAFTESEPEMVKPLRPHIDTALHTRIKDDEPFERDS
jgi:hypothetical protein